METLFLVFRSQRTANIKIELDAMRKAIEWPSGN